jgi:hypothetical protein
MNKPEQVISLQQSQAEKRANLAKWRANRFHEMTLPSGLVVKVMDMTMNDLMFTGKLPPAMTDMIEKSIESGEKEIDLKAITQNMPEFAQIIDSLVMICIKDPPISEHGDEDHIGVDELPGGDKMAIFNFINHETAEVKPFHDEGKPVPPGRDWSEVRDKAKPNPAVKK